MIGSPFERGRPDQYPTSYLCGPRHGRPFIPTELFAGRHIIFVATYRIRLSDHLLPAACAAVLPGGSPFPPSGTADIGRGGSDTPHRFLAVRQGHWCLRRSHNCNSLRTAQSTLWNVRLLLPTPK